MIAASALRWRVIVDCRGPYDEVLKIMAPLNIEPALFREGLGRVADALSEILGPGKPGAPWTCRSCTTLRAE